MPVMDEFKEQREALKSKGPKERLAYFWYYYKWYVIGGIAAVGFLVSFIIEVVNQKEDAFYGVFVNSYASEVNSEKYIQDFANIMNIDTNEYSVGIDSSLFINEDLGEASMTSSQKLMVYTAAGEIDVMASDATTFQPYAYNEMFADLRTILNEAQIKKYEPYFYYMDMAVVKEKQQAMDEMNDSYVPEYPDPKNPAAMKEPVPVALYVNDNEGLKNAYSFTENEVVMGVIVNSGRLETAVGFIDYVFTN